VRNTGADRTQPTTYAAAGRAKCWATSFALCLQIVLLFGAAAAAQGTQPERPYRGLFGQRDRDPKGRQPIDLTMSLSGGYDSNGADQLGTGLLNLRSAGPYSNVDTTLQIIRGRRDRRFTITAGDALRYYPGPGSLLSTNYEGSLALTSPLWRSAHLDAKQGVGYASYYQFELFPTLSLENDMPKGPSSDYAVGSLSAYTYTSAIQFEQKLGTRSALRLGYDRRAVMLSGGASDLLTQTGGVRVIRNVTRYSGFHAGVAARGVQYGRSEGVTQLHTYDVDIGLDYNRPLSLSRRTTIRF
jgi:hypothetical protein